MFLIHFRVYLTLWFSQVEFHFGDDPKICFYGYRGDSGDWLAALNPTLTSNAGTRNFVDIQELLADPFYSIVCRYNTYLLVRYSLSLL